MDKKYVVFISSTYEDLREERALVLQALLELQHIPVGMELFPASNEEQWSLIQGAIDSSDYYVLISAGRYGSIGPDGLGYTEAEYRYAVETGRPVLGFLHEDPSSLPEDRREQSSEGRERLEAFHELVRQKPCRTYSSPAGLDGVVSRSLIQEMRRNPAVGWVRADVAQDHGAAEIIRLREKIQTLRRQIEDLSPNEERPRPEDLVPIGVVITKPLDPDFPIESQRREQSVTVPVRLDEMTCCLGVALGSKVFAAGNAEGAFADELRRGDWRSRISEACEEVRVDKRSVRTALFQLRSLGTVVATDGPRDQQFKLTETGHKLTASVMAKRYRTWESAAP